MADRWEGGAQDTMTGWGEHEVPPRQGTVPSGSGFGTGAGPDFGSDSDFGSGSGSDFGSGSGLGPAPGSGLGSLPGLGAEPDRGTPRANSRDRIATTVMVVGFLLAAVLPVVLCARAWHQAEMVRGVGPSRGVFTVAACGDPQPAKNDRIAYTCTGTFDGRHAAARQASVTADTDFAPGVSEPAYLADTADGGDGRVHLASSDHAAATMALWFTLSCALVCFEGAAVWMLGRRIRGDLVLSRPDKIGIRAFAVCAIGACLWMVALVALQIYYHFG